MQRFTELRVWRAGQDLALALYRATRAFPSEERYGLTAQLRRAGVSIPTNIAEGSKRLTATDYARFINIAEGSAAEIESLLRLAVELELMTAEQGGTLISSTRQLAGILHRLRVTVESAAPHERPR